MSSSLAYYKNNVVLTCRSDDSVTLIKNLGNVPPPTTEWKEHTEVCPIDRHYKGYMALD